MAKYRRKPLIVDAVKLTRAIKVETEEGVMDGNPGDYLITESNGKQYPMEATLFEKTYEPIFDMKLIVKKVLRVIKYKLKEISIKS